MSTETVQAPPAPEEGAKTTPMPTGNPAVSLSSLISSSSLAKKEPPKQEPPKTEEPPKQEAPKVEAAKQEPPKQEPTKDDKDKNFAALRTAKEELEKAAAAQREELERTKSEIAKYQGWLNPEEVSKERENYEKKLADYQRELRVAALHRDPEFQAKYDNAIQSKMERMAIMAATAAGGSREAVAAVQAWDKGKFNEWISEMPPLQQGQFSALVMEIEELDRSRQVETQNADKLWEERQKQIGEQNKKTQDEFRRGFQKDADAVVSEITSDATLAQHPDLVAKIRDEVNRATQLNPDSAMTRRDILNRVATTTVLAHIAQSQQTELEALRAAKEELEKKLAEQEQFITERAGGVPRVGGGTTNGKTSEKYVPLHQRIVVAGR